MFVINNISWKIVLVSPNYPLLWTGNRYALGSCDKLTRAIYINDSITDKQLFKKVLCHQITHAAMFSYSVQLNLDQEQLIADLISSYGEEIISLANKIFGYLIKV